MTPSMPYDMRTISMKKKKQEEDNIHPVDRKGVCDQCGGVVAKQSLINCPTCSYEICEKISDTKQCLHLCGKTYKRCAWCQKRITPSKKNRHHIERYTYCSKSCSSGAAMWHRNNNR